MAEKEEIKALYKEAETYRKQGLLKQSKAKYVEMLRRVEKHEQLSKDKNLLDTINSKLQGVEKEMIEVEEAPMTPRLAEDMQNLISKLFSFSQNKDMAAVEGAIALAQFGQYEKSVAEFRRLIEQGTMPLVAAMNLLRCHLTLSSPQSAVGEFTQWVTRKKFSLSDLTYLRNFLAQHFEKKGIKADLPALEPVPEKKQEVAEEEKEEEAIAISSVCIQLEGGPRKGTVVEFDVTFQSGNKISIIIPSREKDQTAAFKTGLRLANMQCYSAMGVFNGTGTVSSLRTISSGPKKGDCALDITLEAA